MLYLIPGVDYCPTENNIGAAHSPDEDDGVDDYAAPPARVDLPTATPIPHTRRKQSSKSVDDSSDKEFDQAMLQWAGSKDEDTNFALSLVPSLQALNLKEKLDAKTIIHNVLKGVLANRQYTNTNNYLYYQRPGRSSTQNVEVYYSDSNDDSMIDELC